MGSASEWRGERHFNSGQQIKFESGSSYGQLRPMTDYRVDIGEARILFACRRVLSNGEDVKPETNAQEFVLKAKIQVPPREASDDPTEPLPGPSATTAAELSALRMFREKDTEGVPHLIQSKCLAQRADSPFPHGYVSYIIMTKMPGHDLMSLKFWSMTEPEREEIRQAFLNVLKSIWRLGIAPYDCALRNVIWCAETKRCSIVDFEHYHPAKDPINMHEIEELQRWGLAQRPPPSHWAIEWGLIKEPNAS